MRRVLKCVAIFLSITAMYAADKDARFIVKPAAEYPSKVTQEKVTVAAMAYTDEEDVRVAFGKVNPNRYNVLPVLLVIKNDTGQVLRLNLEAEFVDAKGHHIESTPPTDVTYIGAPPKRKDTNIGMGSPIPLPRKKSAGPLNVWEIEGRGFAAKMIPAGEQVSGFFYFQTHMQPGSKFYVTGLSYASSGKELFYFEVPLQ